MLPFPTHASITLAALLLTPPGIYGQDAQWLQDQQTVSKVQQALSSSQFAGSSIHSSVKNGMVKLFGYVRTEQEIQIASESLANITGMKTVMKSLTTPLRR